jgi:hypothetical protein
VVCCGKRRVEGDKNGCEDKKTTKWDEDTVIGRGVSAAAAAAEAVSENESMEVVEGSEGG